MLWSLLCKSIVIFAYSFYYLLLLSLLLLKTNMIQYCEVKQMLIALYSEKKWMTALI